MISNVSPNKKKTAITIDCEHPDRPYVNPRGPDEILDALAEHGVRATFFVQGKWAASNPTTAKRIGNEGHEIGNHSYWHARLSLLTDEGILHDLKLARETVARTTGVDPYPLLRPAYGDGLDDPRVRKVAESLGYEMANWDLDSVDWDWDRSAEAICSTISDAAGKVVLLHSWPIGTAPALQLALPELQKDGVEFHSFSEFRSN